MGFLGIRASLPYLIFMYIEALVLSILFRLLPRKKTWKEVPVQNKVVVITGANSGLGLSVAKSMAKRGARVIMGIMFTFILSSENKIFVYLLRKEIPFNLFALAIRDLNQGQAAMEEIKTETGCASDAISLVHLDLADFSSVRSCADKIIKDNLCIDILINNAGISLNSSKRYYTKEGFELHFGVNYLGHYLLTILLLPILNKAKSPRVVHVTSTALIQSNLMLDDVNLEKGWRGFGYTMHYCNSKFATALFSKELAFREKAMGGKVKSYSLCPGFVKGTNILKNYYGRRLGETFLRTLGLELEKGAEMILYCALAEALESERMSGGLFRFGGKFWSGETLLKQNQKFSKELWAFSEKLVRERRRREE